MPTAFLPTHFLDKAKENGMKSKTGRIVVSWNKFARSLREAVEFYAESKQAELYSFFERLPVKIKETLPLKKAFFAFSPFLVFLLFYSNYGFVRKISGLDELRKPNISFLPWLEYVVFHCYPHRLLAKFANPFLDCLAAIPYLVHFPLPFFFAVYLLSSDSKRSQIFSFLWCAGWVNLIALVIQYIFPTAPPWFVDSAVFSADGQFIKAAPNEAGFHRLDALFGSKVFHGIYSSSPLKFGAFPSLHVAWPAIVLVNDPWISKTFAWLHVILITWAAMYTNHHYGVDALAGIFIVFFVNFCMLQIWSPFGSTRPRTMLIKRYFSRKNMDTKLPVVHSV